VGGVSEKLIPLSYKQVRINKSLLPGGWAVLQKLLFPSVRTVFSIPPCKMLSICSVLPGFQGDCKVAADRTTAQMKEHRYKMEAEMTSFSSVFS
jgi:hypothetical protein